LLGGELLGQSLNAGQGIFRAIIICQRKSNYYLLGRKSLGQLLIARQTIIRAIINCWAGNHLIARGKFIPAIIFFISQLFFYRILLKKAIIYKLLYY